MVFPSGHTASGMKLVHMWATVVISSNLISSCPVLPYVALRKKKKNTLVLHDSESEE